MRQAWGRSVTGMDELRESHYALETRVHDLRAALVNLRETVDLYVSGDVGMPELGDAMDKAYATLYPDADLRVTTP
jgi:hypothetical protein